MDQLNKIIETEDGSHSILRLPLKETYHSTRGAIQESRHVYIQAGLAYLSKLNRPIRLFEMGIGTGLNALLAYQWAEENNCPIEYIGIESDPLDIRVIHALNYGHKVGLQEQFLHFHKASWESSHSLSSLFSFNKLQQNVETFTSEQLFDCIFYDAFAPKYQPDVWAPTVLEKIFGYLNVNGVCVTYCCTGKLVRLCKHRSLIAEKCPGPPGKREMLRIIRPPKPC